MRDCNGSPDLHAGPVGRLAARTWMYPRILWIAAPPRLDLQLRLEMPRRQRRSTRNLRLARIRFYARCARSSVGPFRMPTVGWDTSRSPGAGLPRRNAPGTVRNAIASRLHPWMATTAAVRATRSLADLALEREELAADDGGTRVARGHCSRANRVAWLTFIATAAVALRSRQREARRCDGESRIHPGRRFGRRSAAPRDRRSDRTR